MQTNRYAGKCEACGRTVQAEEGNLEYVGKYSGGRRRKSAYKLWCTNCFDASDNSSEEDRCCGNRAYEDRCAEACGYSPFTGGW